MQHLITKYEDSFIYDSLRTEKKRSGCIVGYVMGFINKIDPKYPDFEGPNMVVATGKEFIAQKIFGNNILSNNTYSPRNFQNYSLTHFGVGSGGATISGEKNILVGPSITDMSLNKPITLGNQSYLNDPSKYIEVGESPLIHSYIKSLKPIINTEDPSLGTIYLESSRYETATDYYTKIKCICVIPPGEPSILRPSEEVIINEAGLYLTNSTKTDIQMFAHICFGGKSISLEDTLTIYWYLLC